MSNVTDWDLSELIESIADEAKYFDLHRCDAKDMASESVELCIEMHELGESPFSILRELIKRGSQ